jgi:prephenate dehydrogenase
MSFDEDEPPFRCDVLLIAGVGLIGGAIAQHARKFGLAKTIIGLGRDEKRLQAAVAAGVIDRIATNSRDVGPVDLAVICTPVNRIVDDVLSLVDNGSTPTLMTDAGSVKEAICEPLSEVRQFVGSHPLAGSEKSGFEHAASVSFQGRVCVLTPPPEAFDDVLRPIDRFWRAIGMQTVTMPARTHDGILARTSHAPHAVAFALANLLRNGDAPYVAGGFRDTTRIAASDAPLWASILLANRTAVRESLKECLSGLSEIEQALERGDEAALTQILNRAQKARRSLDA